MKSLGRPPMPEGHVRLRGVWMSEMCEVVARIPLNNNQMIAIALGSAIGSIGCVFQHDDFISFLTFHFAVQLLGILYLRLNHL